MSSASPGGPTRRLATRLAFFICGFASAGWAPLIPFAKARLGVDEAALGLLLLCAGVGAIGSGALAGAAVARFGTRPVIVAGGAGLCALLPVLAWAGTAPVLGAALFAFGAALSMLDVGMNAHAIEVEAAAGAPLMSGFHGLYSVGGFAGAGFMTAALTIGAPPLWAAVDAAAVGYIALAVAAPRLLPARPAGGRHAFAAPSGVVLLIAALAAAAFLAEGAVLDWGALLIVQHRLAGPAQAGIGYMLFSIAMTVGRFTGDAAVRRLGGRPVLGLGGALAAIGIGVVLLAPWPALAVGGFLLVGLGAANVVPVLFSAAGRQRAMPAPLAVAAVTAVGYAGVLAGPPLLGFVAHAFGLAASFWLVAALFALITLLARPAAQ